MSRSIIDEKSYDFALEIIKFYKYAIKRKEYILSKQLVRSGTSIGANVKEALSAFSKKDFAYKMSIASKEALETKYWLNLFRDSEIIEYDFDGLLEQVSEISRILISIVKTCQTHNSTLKTQN